MKWEGEPGFRASTAEEGEVISRRMGLLFEDFVLRGWAPHEAFEVMYAAILLLHMGTPAARAEIEAALRHLLAQMAEAHS